LGVDMDEKNIKQLEIQVQDLKLEDEYLKKLNEINERYIEDLKEQIKLLISKN
jgi:hypothetical protein